MFRGAYFIEHDFKSWFFQFELHRESRPFFSFRADGNILQRLAIGYRAAPQLGQAVARCVANESVRNSSVLAVVWLDNIVLIDKDLDTLKEASLRFEALCRRYLK